MKGKFVSGTVFAAFLLSWPILSEANQQNSTPPNDNGCCECCPPKDPCAKCAQLWPSCGPDWIIAPGAGPCTADGCDFFVTAEFIYWAVRQDHMTFVKVNPADLSVKAAQFINPNWRMEPGFRVGLGWLTDCDGWDLYVNYTWLRPSTKQKTVTPPVGGSINEDVLNAANVFGTNMSTSAKLKIDFNVLDLEWGRNFYISKCLHLRPHYGLKAAWIDQRFRLTTMGTLNLPPPCLPSTVTGLARNKIDYWGLGPRAGLDSAWHFSRCFSVLGEVAATALWGQFKSKKLATQTDAAGTTTALNTNLQTKWHSVKPVFEFFLGARYEDWWCCEEYYTALDIGWETQWWGGQNQFIAANQSLETRWGDLGFQGLTVRLRLQF